MEVRTPLATAPASEDGQRLLEEDKEEIGAEQWGYGLGKMDGSDLSTVLRLIHWQLSVARPVSQ